MDKVLDVINQTCSVVVSGSSFFSCVYYQNSLSLTLFCGALANAFIGKLLKQILSIKRPSESRRRTNGMPSSHANSLSFFVSYLSFAAWETSPQMGIMTLLLTSSYTLAVCYCRIYRTKDHSLDQILVGLVLGSVNGSLVYLTILPMIQNYFQYS